MAGKHGVVAMAAIAGAAVASAAHGQVVVEKIWERGDPVSGLPAGVVADNFHSTAVSGPTGEVCLMVILVGPGVNSSNRFALVRTTETGGLELIARSQNQAPGTEPGVLFLDSSSSPFQARRVFTDGEFTFSGRLAGPGVNQHNNYGIWRVLPGAGGMQLMLRWGADAPGFEPGVVMLNPSGNVGHDGVVYFECRLSGPGITAENDRAIWAGPAGQLALLAREGDAAPGLPEGTLFTLLNRLQGNLRGDVVFVGRTDRYGEFGTQVWLSDAAGLRAVAHRGDSAPGFPGSKLDSFETASVDAHGRIYFRASVRGAEFGRGLFVHDGVGLSVLAGTGMAIDALPPGHALEWISANNSTGDDPFRANDRGEVVLHGGISGPLYGAWQGTGLMLADAAGLRVVARTQQQAPGLPPGVAFNHFRESLLNNRGQLVFEGRTALSGYDLWYYDGRRIRRVLGEGDQIEVAPGVLRTISSWNFGSNGHLNSPSASSFDDSGRLVISLGFTGEVWGHYSLHLPACWANCDQSTVAPLLNVDDFTCFISSFAHAQSLPVSQQVAHEANCDASTSEPVLNVDDFACFIHEFGMGCP